MFVYGTDIPLNTTLDTDVCIIGSGAAGIPMALEFDGTQTSVFLIEAGDFEFCEKTQDLYTFDSHGLPVDHMSRTRQYGGTTAIWTGRWKLHDPIDFEKRDWVPHSGWPISRKDVDPYYDRAATVLNAPFVKDFERAVLREKLAAGTHDELHNDRLNTEVFQFMKQAEWDFGKTARKQLENSENITVYLRSNVVSLNQEGTRITSVTIKTLDGNTFTIRAKQFVLACGGIENARLMMLSGVGNENVGKYYMDHPKGKSGSVKLFGNTHLPAYFESETAEGPQTVAGIRLSDDLQRQHEILNSYVLLEPEYPWTNHKSVDALAAFLRGERMVSNAFKAALGVPTITRLAMNKVARNKARPVRLALRNYMEQAPDERNRIELTEEHDALGCRKAAVHWNIYDLDRRTMKILHETLADELKERGIGTLSSPLFSDTETDWPIRTDASHHMGTTRMGTDPQTSVVDEHCFAHGVDNLSIAGSSVFVTSGYANPTATIVALAIRLADQIKERL